MGDAWWKTTAWKGRIRDVTRRIGKTEREVSYVAKVGENASGKHVATLWHQEDWLRQDAECDGMIHHGEGFYNLASGSSEAPDANLLVADVDNDRFLTRKKQVRCQQCPEIVECDPNMASGLMECKPCENANWLDGPSASEIAGARD